MPTSLGGHVREIASQEELRHRTRTISSPEFLIGNLPCDSSGQITREPDLVSNRGSNILRWIAVLPTALTAAYALQMLTLPLLRALSGGFPLIDGLRIALYHSIWPMAFVLAGAILAPSRRLATAVVLMVLGILLSLQIHIVGQFVAGNRVGVTN